MEFMPPPDPLATSFFSPEDLRLILQRYPGSGIYLRDAVAAGRALGLPRPWDWGTGPLPSYRTSEWLRAIRAANVDCTAKRVKLVYQRWLRCQTLTAPPGRLPLPHPPR